MENTRDEESSMKASKMNKSFQMIPWESDDIPDEQETDYKQLSYKLFQYRTYKLGGSNGEFRCPFCADYEKEEDDFHCTRLLLHAIRVAETSVICKERANHFAMARYLAFDLADQVIAKAQQSPSAQYRKRPRLDEESSGGVVQMDEAFVKLETELNETKDQMNDLIRIERLSNDELQGARRELVKGFNDILGGNHVQFGIKNIGEIDSKVFIKEMEKRFSPLCAVMKGVELCSLWQGKVTNPQWYPFQIVKDDNGKPQRLLKEDDISLQNLKRKWGREIHDAVVEALNEWHEYNPRGCCVIPELWNFKENRKAKLDEVIHYILEAVNDFLKMGSASGINNPRIEGQRERGDPLKMGSSTSYINDSDEETDSSEIYHHKERIYKLLKSCTYQVRGNNGQLRCPFCSVEQEHDYNYLLRHALTIAEGSSESVEQRASHFALAKYLVIDLQAVAEPPPQDLQHVTCRMEDEKKEKALKILLKDNEELKSSKAELLEKKRQSSDQLRRVRKVLIKGLTVWRRGNNACIRIKKMGEIDVIAFKKSCMHMKEFLSLPRRMGENAAVHLCSVWQEQLKCSNWHPFCIIGDDKGNLERQLNEDDELLRDLKERCGDEAFNAVVIAFKNMIKYSKSRGHIDIVPVLWNFHENRKAEVEEVIGFVFKELMAQKRKETEKRAILRLLIKN